MGNLRQYTQIYTYTFTFYLKQSLAYKEEKLGSSKQDFRFNYYTKVITIKLS